MASISMQLSCSDYRVAWICPVADLELLPARLMLDEEHPAPPYDTHFDENTYICGTINGHTVVIATCSQGETGNVNAGRLTGPMFKTFPNITMVVLVGIGGGIPRSTVPEDSLDDIHLGDVVVGWPGDGNPACVYFDRGKSKAGGQFEMVGTLPNPTWRLTNPLSILASNHELRRATFNEQLARLRNFKKFAHPGLEHDTLFETNYHHSGGSGTDCRDCNSSKLVKRPTRTESDKDEFVFHQGRIATGNSVIKDGERRDEIRESCPGTLCIEMEAAGVNTNKECLVIRGISDYADSHKTDKWRYYAAGKAAAFTRELLGIIPIGQAVKNIEATSEVKWTKPEQKCVQALRTSEYEQFKDRNPDRLEGTCEWVFQQTTFQDWRDSRSSSLLWISADPGCGKSVLAKSLIDQELESRTTCYFFFKDDNDKQKSIATALSALLHQLFSQKPLLVQYAIPDYETEGNQLPLSVHKLWSILIKAASDPKAGEIICILDALDECTENERNQIINILCTFYKHRQDTFQLKFLITSRPYFEIERRFAGLAGKFPTIRLRGESESEAISREISIVIKSKVSEIRQELDLDSAEELLLQTELLGMEHRTYLWLKLILDAIRDSLGVTKKKLKNIIKTLPTTVGDAYEAILSKTKDHKKTQKLLHIVVVAARPLTLREMNIALAIENHHTSCEELDLESEERFQTTIRNLCGLFVSIVDHKVYLLHQTAKEFLIAKKEASNGCWKYSLDPVESELVLANVCITYIMFTPSKKSLMDDNLTSENRKRQWREETDGFFEYVARFWAIHYKAAQSKETPRILDSIFTLYNKRSSRFQRFLDLSSNSNSQYSPLPTSNSMILGSFFGHASVVKLLLEAGADIGSEDRYSRTPLSWAAENGHASVVALLLEAGADIESKDEYSRTPLWWAAANWHASVVKLLRSVTSIHP